MIACTLVFENDETNEKKRKEYIQSIVSGLAFFVYNSSRKRSLITVKLEINWCDFTGKCSILY
jgi:hypothetical protein